MCVCVQGAVLINENAARIVERHMVFKEGIAYGIDQLLEPPGLGAFCDMMTNKTTYVSSANANYFSTVAVSCSRRSPDVFCLQYVSGALWLLRNATTLPLPCHRYSKLRNKESEY